MTGFLTQTDAAVLEQVAEVVEHGPLVLATDPAEVAEEATAVGHHPWESDLLQRGRRERQTEIVVVVKVIVKLSITSQ